jgi:SOS response regulatory protein OraA/RecX
MTDSPPIITAIAPNPDEPNLRTVMVDEQAVLSLPANAIDTLALDVGQPWTSALEASARLEVTVTQARAEALAMLGRKDLSCAELSDRLEACGYEQAAAQRAVALLAAERWLDDEALAQTIVGKMLAGRPAGPELLTERLLQRRIDAALAQRVVETALEGKDLIEQATSLADRQLGDDRQMASVRRVAAALQRRGFHDDTIAAALDRLGLADGIE